MSGSVESRGNIPEKLDERDSCLGIWRRLSDRLVGPKEGSRSMGPSPEKVFSCWFQVISGRLGHSKGRAGSVVNFPAA